MNLTKMEFAHLLEDYLNGFERSMELCGKYHFTSHTLSKLLKDEKCLIETFGVSVIPKVKEQSELRQKFKAKQSFTFPILSDPVLCCLVKKDRLKENPYVSPKEVSLLKRVAIYFAYQGNSEQILREVPSCSNFYLGEFLSQESGLEQLLSPLSYQRLKELQKVDLLYIHHAVKDKNTLVTETVTNFLNTNSLIQTARELELDVESVRRLLQDPYVSFLGCSSEELATIRKGIQSPEKSKYQLTIELADYVIQNNTSLKDTAQAFGLSNKLAKVCLDRYLPQLNPGKGILVRSIFIQKKSSKKEIASSNTLATTKVTPRKDRFFSNLETYCSRYMNKEPFLDPREKIQKRTELMNELITYRDRLLCISNISEQGKKKGYSWISSQMKRMKYPFQLEIIDYYLKHEEPLEKVLELFGMTLGRFLALMEDRKFFIDHYPDTYPNIVCQCIQKLNQEGFCYKIVPKK